MSGLGDSWEGGATWLSLDDCSLGIAGFSSKKAISNFSNTYFISLAQAEEPKLIQLALSFFLIFLLPFENI